ncbi:MAG: phosphatase PAP2 family protein [Flavobacteriia bacterium]|jgi:membrane-associated phospholipid phosphatase
MKILAEVLSWVFLPLLMPVYGLLLAMYVPSNQDYLFNEDSLFFLRDEAKLAILYMFIIFSVIAPGLAFVLLHKWKIITTIDMENQRERNIPMFIMLTFCLILFFLFLIKAENNVLPKYIYALPLSGVFVTVIYTYINRWIKISLHGGGAGILTGFLFAYAIEQAEFQFWILIFAIVASGLTIGARLYLKKHTQTEVYTGWALAVLMTFLVNYLYPIG